MFAGACTLWALGLVSAPVLRADDWLAVLPACGFAGRASIPSFELLYPRPGLPAVVAAGDTLIVRVRVPAPLTPPPGIQQSRALVGWRAELIGHALGWPPRAGTERELRHALPVIDVRPDGSQSLVYRAALALPAWLAPGSYDLALEAPSGNGTARAGVRVLAQGTGAKLAWYAGDALEPSLALGALPIDVFVQAEPRAVSAEAELTRAGPPLLDPYRLVAALRLEQGELWVLGACDASELTFDAEVESVLAQEQRERVEPRAQLAAGQFQPFGAEARSLPARDAVQLTNAEDEDGVRVRVLPDFPGAAVIAFALPNDGRRIELNAMDAALHPGGELSSSLPWLVALTRVRAGEEGRLTRSAPAARPKASLSVRPSRARSLAPFELSVRGVDEPARVAWRIDERRTAFGPATLETRFGPLGQHSVVALPLVHTGKSPLLRAELLVQTDQASSCRCGLGQPRRPGCGFAALCVCGALALGQRRKKPR